MGGILTKEMLAKAMTPDSADHLHILKRIDWTITMGVHVQ
jgi:hypothetical protein